MSVDAPEIRHMLNLIVEKYGKDVKIVIRNNGSGYIALIAVHPERVAEFDSLAALIELLQ